MLGIYLSMLNSAADQEAFQACMKGISTKCSMQRRVL